MPKEQEESMVLSLTDFSGGINNSVPPQFLSDSEYQKILNFEYDMNRLKTRGGLSEEIATYPTDVRAFYYDEGTGQCIVCLKNGDIYEEDFVSIHNKVGELSGASKPRFCSFDSKVFIASGGHLQYYDYQTHTVATIEASKLCDVVFERMGRLVIAVSGDDNLYYSAVGDPYETGWEENTNDESMSQWLEIGYKDNGDIMSVKPISGDIAIFKTNGRIYTLSGETPAWSLTQTGELSGAISADSIVNLGSSVVFMTDAGLKSLDAVATYGNFSVNEVGRKFNRYFAGKLYNPVMYNIIRKRQLLIIPNASDSRKVFCYQYDLGAGIMFEFSVPITDMQDGVGGVLIASGKGIRRWDNAYKDDDGTAIEQEIVTKQMTSTRRIYSRRLEASFVGDVGKYKDVYLTWADKTIKYRLGRKRKTVEFFSVCSQSELKLKTDDYIEIEYINLYLTQR